ncbi:Glycosyl Hydrolase Family 88 [Pleurostoma richardsiae]|uniref:Glycosyl Hydrolase Family 88 n=1 Tax=Pleurostoma richardsiae TaxID=41990 RepID=A0AA38VIK8_9PEZI|nr:Glycosyl Hydrolase Family 88 [Pleurostoma richardsiae]
MRVAGAISSNMRAHLTAISFIALFFPSYGYAHEPYSTQMLRSIIARQQGIISSGAATSTLESGILALALEAWLDHYPPEVEPAPRFSNYLSQVLLSIDPTFVNSTSAALLPLDRLTVGQAIRHLGLRATAAESSVLATLNASLSVQRRNQYGGLWYYVYPEWSYLDGTVSFLPFMAADSGWSRADMLNQIMLLYSHCYDNASGLVVHGYDASKTAVWANPLTGASPFVWGRSLGWYLAGLVNAWEALQSNGDCDDGEDSTRLQDTIAVQTSDLISALIKLPDLDTGTWWQLPTLGGQPGNFLESSSTALFVFTILKSSRLGLLRHTEGAVHAALRAYDYAASHFVVSNDDGTLGYNGTVSVCSLNSTASYEYYTTRPLVPDSLLGESAFVLASLEVEWMA